MRSLFGNNSSTESRSLFGAGNRSLFSSEQPISDSREPSTATGAAPWYERLITNVVPFALKPFQFLNTFSVYGGATRAAIQQNVEGLRGERARRLYLPDYPTWNEAMSGQYAQPEQAGLAMSQFADSLMGMPGMNIGMQIERMIRGPETAENQFITSGRAITPDTFEQAYETIKDFSEMINFQGTSVALLPNPETGKLELQEVPVTVGIPEWIQAIAAGLWNEQTISQIQSDPLIIWEAANMGRKTLNALLVGIDAVNKPIGAWRGATRALEQIPRESQTWNQATRIMANRALSTTAEFSHQVSGLAWRRVYRAARFPGAKAEMELTNRARINYTAQQGL